jgi:Domain of unknown function (DUF4832)/Domain of unknown function (DUF4874)
MTTKFRRARFFSTLGVGLLCLGAAAPLSAPAATAKLPVGAGSITADYTESTETIANPERGFYHHPGDCDDHDFDVQTLAGYREENEKVTLVMCLFYLREFKVLPISQGQLDRFDRQAEAVGAAGLKMIVRFAYTDSESGDDAPLSRVQEHLGQLAPYFTKHRDVIEVVQSGFVGAWGEGYYTQNFGNNGVVSEADWNNRKAVVDKLLSVVPADRMVQVRTPTMKRRMYGTVPVAAAAAYRGTPVARVGHHNDCFLASRTDSGTYQDPGVEYPYLAADTRYVAMGGETCMPNPPRSDCPTALSEMGMFHYSYLNTDHKEAVLDGWARDGCLGQVAQRLGYRFTLLSSSLPTSVTRGTAMPAQISIKNTGWSAPFNPRPMRLVLRNTSTGAVHEVRTPYDPRHWQAGTTVALNQPITIPTTVPAGTYALLLNFPDPMRDLATRPEYAIQLANTGLWEPATGLNNLLHTIRVQ